MEEKHEIVDNFFELFNFSGNVLCANAVKMRVIDRYFYKTRIVYAGFLADIPVLKRAISKNDRIKE